MRIFGDQRLNIIVGSGAAVLLLAAVAGGLMSPKGRMNADPLPRANALKQGKGNGPVPPTMIGINLTDLQYWNKNRAFGNLLMGGNWQLKMPGKGYTTLPARYITAEGGLMPLPQGGQAVRSLSQPMTGPAGVTIKCTFEGKGIFRVSGGYDVISKEKEFSFRLVNDNKEKHIINIYIEQYDQFSEIRNIDCREKNYDKSALFDQNFINFVRQFNLIRFMDLQNTNANRAITWKNRKLPTYNSAVDREGMSIEHMVSLANSAKADAWFNMPWNASDDYIEGFARYTFENLGPGQTVYVELSNEVWNWGFPVAHQSSKEGLALNLSKNGFEALLFRYAEKTKHVMEIWNRVYKNDRTRLVRVVASQSVNPWTAEQVLWYKDTYKYVDALATAPYFGKANCDPPTDSLENDVFKCMENNIKFTVEKSLENKRVAHKYGKRFIAYEAGQHLILRDNVKLLEKISRDQRMYDLYKKYIHGWKTEVGDTMVLFSSISPVSQYGAWGLLEYPNQPLSEAPKMRAVQDTGLLR